MERRRVDWDGKVEYVGEDVVQNQIERYDFENFQKNNKGYYETTIKCLLCHMYNADCVKCIAKVYGPGTCQDLFNRLVPNFQKIFTTSANAMKFKETDLEEAKAGLKIIRDYFSNLPKEE